MMFYSRIVFLAQSPGLKLRIYNANVYLCLMRTVSTFDYIYIAETLSPPDLMLSPCWSKGLELSVTTFSHLPK